MPNFRIWTFAVLCIKLLATANATPSPVVAARAGCPTPVSNPNGGFEDSTFAPWTVISGPSTITQQVVKPGFNGSTYSLQVNVPATRPGQVTEYGISDYMAGKECFNAYYSIKYSWNWKSYTGPEGSGDSYCSFSAGTGYTDGNVDHYATRKAGWHVNSYVGRDIYSHGKPANAVYVASVICVASNSSSIPAFTILLDNLHVTNA